VVPPCSCRGPQRSADQLGHMLLLRVTGVAKDAEQAVSWYRRAAEAGHADAQFNLGISLH